MTAVVEPVRLDVWLATERSITRHAAHVLIESGAVTVNGRPGRPGQRLRDADEVLVDADIASPEPAPLTGETVDLVIVYEDEWLAVIDKPAGLVVHPAPGHPDGTVADGLRQRGTTWSLLGGTERAGIVHRLDRDTSGLMVVAKTEAAHRGLAAQLADRSLGRRYWALVHGGVDEATARIDAPIGRDTRDRKRMAVVDEGRDAITDFEVVERLKNHTVLDVSLKTGRTHQIRVHLSHIGKPIVGDPVYGRRAERSRGFGRPALHARQLRFLHPNDGTPRSFDAPLPEDLRQLLESLRKGGDNE